MGVTAGFWAGKTVLVTGHTGFKGSWLSLWLTTLGAKPSGLSLGKPSVPCCFDACRVDTLVESLDVDIRSLDQVERALRQHKPDVVLHLAAQALVRPSYVDPVGTYATNVMGTVHVMEAVRKTESVQVVLSVTSDKCYENQEWVDGPTARTIRWAAMTPIAVVRAARNWSCPPTAGHFSKLTVPLALPQPEPEMYLAAVIGLSIV